MSSDLHTEMAELRAEYDAMSADEKEMADLVLETIEEFAQVMQVSIDTMRTSLTSSTAG